jgi:CBS domain containing-hemolysin-like protein
MNGLLILLFVACLGTAFLLSGMEAGVFALSRLRIRQQMRAGNPRARALYAYLDKPEDFLWTILVGNTVASVAVVSIGVLGLHHWLREWPAAVWLALVGAGTLFYALCELLPKMLFRLYPNRLCLMMALPFGTVHLALRPLVKLMEWFARGLLRWSGGRTFTGRLFGNREELRIVMQESAQAMTSEERAMINRVLDLQNLSVRQITVPLAKVVAVAASTPLKELVTVYRASGHGQLPVWQQEGGRPRLAGLVDVKALLYEENLDWHRTAGDLLQPALYLDAEARLEVALRQMQRSGQRLAIVLGPDRAELGVVGLQDILTVIFGEVTL